MATFKKKYSDINFEYFYKESETEQNDDLSRYTKIYESRKKLTIVLGKAGYISIDKHSLIKIFTKSELLPEEQILFTYYNPLDSEPHQKINQQLQTLNELITNQNTTMAGNVQEEKQQENKADLISIPQDSTEIQFETKINKFSKFIDKLNYIFLIYVIFSLLNLIYFGITLIKNEPIQLFQIITILSAVIFINIGIIGFILVNDIKQKSLPLILVGISILITIIHFSLGIAKNKGKPIWLVYVVNIIAILYEIFMIGICLIIQKHFQNINERLLEINAESKTIISSEISA